MVLVCLPTILAMMVLATSLTSVIGFLTVKITQDRRSGYKMGKLSHWCKRAYPITRITQKTIPRPRTHARMCTRTRVCARVWGYICFSGYLGKYNKNNNLAYPGLGNFSDRRVTIMDSIS